MPSGEGTGQGPRVPLPRRAELGCPRERGRGDARGSGSEGAAGLHPSRFRTDAPSRPLWPPRATSPVEKGHALGRAAPGPGAPSWRRVKPRALPYRLPVSARAGPSGTGSDTAAAAPDGAGLASGSVTATAVRHTLPRSLSEEPLKSRGRGGAGHLAARLRVGACVHSSVCFGDPCRKRAVPEGLCSPSPPVPVPRVPRSPPSCPPVPLSQLGRCWEGPWRRGQEPADLSPPALQGDRQEGGRPHQRPAAGPALLPEGVLLHHAGRHAAAAPHRAGGHDGERPPAPALAPGHPRPRPRLPRRQRAAGTASSETNPSPWVLMAPDQGNWGDHGPPLHGPKACPSHQPSCSSWLWAQVAVSLVTGLGP